MTLLTLFAEFFKTGLFAVGGGLATIPFLSQMADKYPWFSKQMLTDMIAVAESTPGPMGVNMATYAGYTAAKIIGALTATLGLVTPSVIVVIIVSKVLEKFKENKIVQGAFYGLRPAVAGLITAASFELFKLSIYNGTAESFHLKGAIGFAIGVFVVLKFKKLNPILIIILGAVAGVVFKMA